MPDTLFNTQANTPDFLAFRKEYTREDVSYLLYMLANGKKEDRN